MTCTPTGACHRRQVGACQRPECVTRSRAYTKRNRTLEARNVPRRVPSGPTAERLAELRQAYSVGYLARAFDVSTAQISTLSRGRHRNVSVELARKIAGPMRHVESAAWIDATGTRRRLQALAYNGWSFAAIGQRADLPAAWVQFVGSRNIERTDVQRARRIAEVFAELWDVPGPSQITRRRAVAAGYVPALAWDCIDDPDEQPQGVVTELTRHGDTLIDEAAVERRLAGDRVALTNAERIEVVRRAHGNGWNDAQTERATGIDARQVIRDRQRLGLEANYWQDVERKDGAA